MTSDKLFGLNLGILRIGVIKYATHESTKFHIGIDSEFKFLFIKRFRIGITVWTI